MRKEKINIIPNNHSHECYLYSLLTVGAGLGAWLGESDGALLGLAVGFG